MKNINLFVPTFRNEEITEHKNNLSDYLDIILKTSIDGYIDYLSNS
jgi:hypothetical protein